MDQYSWVSQTCPICEIPPTKYMGRRGGNAHRSRLGVECEIWSCGRCGLIFPNPMPHPVAGAEQHYDLTPDEFFRNHEIQAKEVAAEAMLTRAESLTGGKRRLLDIGAGRGELLRKAKMMGWSAVGVEPSASFAEFAIAYSGAEIRREPLERCAFEDESFDVVVLGAVLEHLYNPDETIHEISRLLRKGGALYVDVPNETGLYFRIGNLYARLRGRDWVVNLAPTFSPFHIFGFSPRSLRALLSKHSLQPKDWRVYGGRSMVPSTGSVIGLLERLGARGVTFVSNMREWGTYIETWAIRL
jgi:2-polyprenyl-3-methyl-5-hydroxy-6-metoxy-1,4-benzoquinol methylase